eukprot:COSAG01_NODE_41324_length_453_cov_0.723164_1_plen_69_part_10
MAEKRQRQLDEDTVNYDSPIGDEVDSPVGDEDQETISMEQEVKAKKASKGGEYSGSSMEQEKKTKKISQ